MARIITELLIALLMGVIGIVIAFLWFGGEYSRSFRFRNSAHAGGRWRLGPKKESKVSEDKEHVLKHGGRERRYLVHVPKGYDPSKRYPVVLAFHGGAARPEAQRIQSRLNEVSDRHGFLVVYPAGTGLLAKFLTFNAGTCCGYAVRRRVDDVGFVRQLLGDLPHQYSVDSQRVYATGMSNGAMMCYRLACELSDRIAAIAPVAGTMAVSGPKPRRPVPVMHFHGRKDNNVPFGGGVGTNSLQRRPHQSVEATLSWWVKVNGCEAKPARVQKHDDYICTKYAPGTGKTGAPVVLYELLEGGHTWPGGVDVSAHLGTGKMVTTVDASTLMWHFFKQHKLAGLAATR